VTGRQILIPEVREATALGGAAAAATGIGQFASLPEAGAAFAKWERTVEPNRANCADYDEARAR